MVRFYPVEQIQFYDKETVYTDVTYKTEESIFACHWFIHPIRCDRDKWSLSDDCIKVII